jgi:hypothetical protein
MDGGIEDQIATAWWGILLTIPNVLAFIKHGD